MTTLLPAFALASTLLILAPGPDSLLVLRNTLRHGRRAGWVTASGTLSGLLAWAAAAAQGVAQDQQAVRARREYQQGRGEGKRRQQGGHRGWPPISRRAAGADYPS